MFHITPKANWDKIRGRGLIPGHARGISCCPATERKKLLWLTDDIRHILTTQCGLYWVKRTQPLVLSLDVSGLSLTKFEYYDRDAPHEWTYDKPIGMERILSAVEVPDDILSELEILRN